MRDYFELFRGKNIFIALFAMFLMLWLVGLDKVNSDFYLGILIVVFIMIGANVLNDIQDFSIDKINRPDSPLVSGNISFQAARWSTFLCFIFAIALGFFIPVAAMKIVLASILLLVFYTSVFKPLPLLGNIIVATISALLFIFSGALLGDISAGIIPAFLAFGIHLIREIVKDFEDVEGDRKSGMKTLPIVWENKKVVSLLRYLSVLFLLFLLVLIYTGVYGKLFALLLIIGVIPYFVYFFIEMNKKNLTKKDFHRHSQLLKVEMFIGLISMGVGNWFTTY